VEKSPVGDVVATGTCAVYIGFVKNLEVSIVLFYYQYRFQLFTVIRKKEKKQEGEARANDDVEAPRC